MNQMQATRPTGRGIFEGYLPNGACFDEVFVSPGVARPHWGEFLANISSVGQAELSRRWLHSQEEIHNEGIAYNISDETGAVSRPWELDLLPLLISAEEWSSLQVGLKQRAGLLNRILADLYGPQELLSGGMIPSEWLFSHPGFRRVFHGQQPRDGVFLHYYAADLARAPDGRWWVVGNRTDAPLGVGYALENRIATSRMLPDQFSRFHIERLAPFFKTLQETLQALASGRRDNPHIVLLSHGPSGPNYFEDAYLARYLGFTLVEGGDLAVRDSHVYLKTLAGLLPVDVIFRRMGDEFCDPLETRSVAGFGVPGLLQAARLGHVVVANTLGSSLVESPSLVPFLPGIARQWLGEELALPSVATWWCGQEKAREQVLARIEQGTFDRNSIRAAYRVGRMDAIPPEVEEAKSLPELARLLTRRPHDFIAREAVKCSTSPVWCDTIPTPWHVALRVYLVAEGDSYHVMPGGLVRLAKEAAPLDQSILRGRLTKDAWVQSNVPVQEVSLLATTHQPVVLRRSGAELPSRVADNLFWFGRSIERSQGSTRLLRLLVSRLTGEGDLGSSEALFCLIHCLAAQGQLEPGFAVEKLKDRLPTIANVLPATVLDEQQLGSLRATFATAHRNASLVRDRLSLDSWRIVHHIERSLGRAADLRQSLESAAKTTVQPFGLVELDELLDELIVSLSALDGLIGESMTRTPAWRFLELGRRLERSLQVVSLVQSIAATPLPEEGRALQTMLEVADSLMTYRARYLAAVNRAATLDLLLTDETNPRSLAFQLASISDHVANLPTDKTKPLGTAEERIASSLLHGIRMIEIDDLSEGGGERTKLGRFLQRVVDQLPRLSDLISHRYLIHAGVPRQMSDGNRS